MPLLIGNLCSLLAMVTDAISASRKTAKSMLLVQILSQIIYGTGAIALKGYSAAVQNAVAILRNVAAIRKVQSKWAEWLLVALAVVLGLLFNNLGTIGLLPVVANFIYSVAIFAFKDNERVIKGAFAVNMALFTVFNALILNFVGTATNAVLAVSTTAFVIRDIKQSRKASQ